jgi:hypothetical protein
VNSLYPASVLPVRGLPDDDDELEDDELEDDELEDELPDARSLHALSSQMRPVAQSASFSQPPPELGMHATFMSANAIENIMADDNNKQRLNESARCMESSCCNGCIPQ